MSELNDFASRLAKPWGPLVTSFIGLIGESKGHFDSAEYKRQLKHEVDS
jgi:hypothetical protein